MNDKELKDLAEELCENIKTNVAAFWKWMAENRPEYPRDCPERDKK